jgi:hypothetical protein
MSVEIDAAPDAVAAALLDIYVRSHAWDPPGDIDVGDVLASHVAEAAVTPMVRDATGVVLAAAALYDRARRRNSRSPRHPGRRSPYRRRRRSRLPPAVTDGLR